MYIGINNLQKHKALDKLFNNNLMNLVNDEKTIEDVSKFQWV